MAPKDMKTCNACICCYQALDFADVKLLCFVGRAVLRLRQDGLAAARACSARAGEADKDKGEICNLGLVVCSYGLRPGRVLQEPPGLPPRPRPAALPFTTTSSPGLCVLASPPGPAPRRPAASCPSRGDDDHGPTARRPGRQPRPRDARRPAAPSAAAGGAASTQTRRPTP